MRWLKVVLAGGMLAWLVPAAVSAQNGMAVEEVERIVKDYLLREPEILYQALQELQRRREASETAQQRQRIAERHAALFADAADPVLGDGTGDVTLVEFFDYRCAYCRSMMPAIRALLDRDRRLKIVLKEFPILGPESEVASRAALAARAQGRYGEMHWALLQAKDLSEAAVLELARRQGLDPVRLQRDMRSPEVEQTIARNRALAEELGISGTPTFVIGDTLIPGAAPVARLAELIAKERAPQN